MLFVGNSSLQMTEKLETGGKIQIDFELQQTKLTLEIKKPKKNKL